MKSTIVLTSTPQLIAQGPHREDSAVMRYRIVNIGTQPFAVGITAAQALAELANGETFANTDAGYTCMAQQQYPWQLWAVVATGTNRIHVITENIDPYSDNVNDDDGPVIVP